VEEVLKAKKERAEANFKAGFLVKKRNLLNQN
jgi:hypothetical protein